MICKRILSSWLCKCVQLITMDPSLFSYVKARECYRSSLLFMFPSWCFLLLFCLLVFPSSCSWVFPFGISFLVFPSWCCLLGVSLFVSLVFLWCFHLAYIFSEFEYVGKYSEQCASGALAYYHSSKLLRGGGGRCCWEVSSNRADVSNGVP